MTTLEFDRFGPQGIGYTGAVKFKTNEAGGCCGCSSADSSIVVFYSNGAAIDLWTCDGCKCLQSPVGPIDLPPKTPMALHPGASLPEEVCSSSCYQKALADGDGGFAGAWKESKAIGELALDGLQLSFVNAELQKQIAILEKQAYVQITTLEKPMDPVEAYLKSLEESC